MTVNGVRFRNFHHHIDAGKDSLLHFALGRPKKPDGDRNGLIKVVNRRFELGVVCSSGFVPILDKVGGVFCGSDSFT